MELLALQPTDTLLWDQAWNLYETSFPAHERRRKEDHLRAMQEESEFHCIIAVRRGENGTAPTLLALLYYWEHGSMIYIEHLAVDPALRGQNIGSALLGQFLANHVDSTSLLEIEPPTDETTQRRLRFYRHLGFVVNDYEYLHPSYGTGPTHPLTILSYPHAVTQGEFDRFLNYMQTKVLTYTAAPTATPPCK